MSLETNRIGIAHPNKVFTEGLATFLRKKTLQVVSVPEDRVSQLEPGKGIDLLILDAKLFSFRRPDMPTIIIDNPTSLEKGSDLAVDHLEKGADGYFPENVNPRVLALFTRATLRRIELAAGDNPLPTFGDIALDKIKREVSLKGSIINLKRREFNLLALLMKDPGRIFTRDEILDEAWNVDVYPSTVDNHISFLRRKIAGSNEVCIKTISGVGYGLCLKKGR